MDLYVAKTHGHSRALIDEHRVVEYQLSDKIFRYDWVSVYVLSNLNTTLQIIRYIQLIKPWLSCMLVCTEVLLVVCQEDCFFKFQPLLLHKHCMSNVLFIICLAR